MTKTPTGNHKGREEHEKGKPAIYINGKVTKWKEARTSLASFFELFVCFLID